MNDNKKHTSEAHTAKPSSVTAGYLTKFGQNHLKEIDGHLDSVDSALAAGNLHRATAHLLCIKSQRKIFREIEGI